MTRCHPARLLLWSGLAAVAVMAGCADSASDEYHEVSSAEARIEPVTPEAPAAATDEKPAPAERSEPAAEVADGGTPEPQSPPQDEPDQPEPAAEVASSEPPDDEAITPVVATRPIARPAIPSLLPTGPRGASAGPAIPQAKPLPGGIRILVKDKSFTPEGPEGAVRVSYDDIDLLKVMNAEPVPVDVVEQMPQWLKDLDGRRIRIRGFMYPPPLEEGLRGFVLARDNQICCFGRDPKRYDVIDVFLRDGVTASYIQNRPFDVVGIFHIQPEAAGGQLYQLYVIDDAIVIDK